MVFMETSKLSHIFMIVVGLVLLIFGEAVFPFTLQVFGLALVVLGILDLIVRTEGWPRSNLHCAIDLVIGVTLLLFSRTIFLVTVKLIIVLLLAYLVTQFVIRENLFSRYHKTPLGIIHIVVTIFFSILLFTNGSIDLFVRILGGGTLYAGITGFWKIY